MSRVAPHSQPSGRPDLAPGIHRQRLVVEGTMEEALDDERICEYLRRLGDVVGVELRDEPVTHRSPRYGWAGWIHWDRCGAHLYAWEDPSLFFSVDVYACTPFDALTVVRFTEAFFQETRVAAREI